jgi:hypothetical protein
LVVLGSKAAAAIATMEALGSFVHTVDIKSFKAAVQDQIAIYLTQKPD